MSRIEEVNVEKVVLEQCSDARLLDCHGRVTMPSDRIPTSDRKHQVGQPRLRSESEVRPYSCHARGGACLPTLFQESVDRENWYNMIMLVLGIHWQILELSARTGQRSEPIKCRDFVSWSTFSSKIATRKHPNFLLLGLTYSRDLRDLLCQTGTLSAAH